MELQEWARRVFHGDSLGEKLLPPLRSGTLAIAADLDRVRVEL
jgi:hypothetical protein